MPILDCQIGDLVAPLPLLDFPPGQIGINKEVRIGLNQRCTRANDERYTVRIVT